MFCDGDVILNDRSKGLPITLPGRGIAHTYCAEDDLAKRRIFGNIHIADLDDDDLLELKEMVLAEVNIRHGVDQEAEII
ncbi:hypothetical protein C2869_12705 [Saccharobesus litoralis]|uniref:Uncharacterized protein n=2 Tax=Saccharobesus litoralis TaxID=2172099 RepID=A0A2S0VSP8_9ALTE|nr:hypothetical protein C2869_12705 [Saccharobesus litoralis]